MTTKLTDTERTLLSALRDGELSGAEKVHAERLMETSEEAREYLRDLRSLTDISRSSFPAPSVTGIGAGLGSKLSSAAIQTAARTTSKSGMILGWGATGLAAAAVATIAVLSSTPGGDVAEKPVPPAAASNANAASVVMASLDVDSSALMVPAITSRELIDFAMSGRLPIDSTRECYLSVAPRMGALSIAVHEAPGDVPIELGAFDLRAVPGIDSLQRAIRTSVLQSEENGLAVSCELPSLRLRVLAELQEVGHELPASLRRTMVGTLAKLELEFRHFGPDPQRPSARRTNASATRYFVVNDADLRKRIDNGLRNVSFTITAGDDNVRTLELSGAEIERLASFVDRHSVDIARTSINAPADVVTVTPSRPKVFMRRPPTAARAGRAVPQAPALADSTISFEQIQMMRRRGQTLDGIFTETEAFIDRATMILQRADSIRRHIEIIRMQQVDGAREDLDFADEDDDTEAAYDGAKHEQVEENLP